MRRTGWLPGRAGTSATRALAAPVPAGGRVPFKGTFAGVAVSAVPTDDPEVLFVTTVGSGQATHLGNYQMVSPHYFNVVTLEVLAGTQEFTAANGDTLTADVSGQFYPIAGGFIAAQLDATITGGSGRVPGAPRRLSVRIPFYPPTVVFLPPLPRGVAND